MTLTTTQGVIQTTPGSLSYRPRTRAKPTGGKARWSFGFTPARYVLICENDWLLDGLVKDPAFVAAVRRVRSRIRRISKRR